MTLEDCSAKLEVYDGLIQNNYRNLNTFLVSLKESIDAEVAAKLALMNPAPTVMDTVELDANWWSENAERLGWTKDGNYYKYIDPASGETYMYDPDSSSLKVILSNGKTTYKTSCKFYLNGDLNDVTDTVTLLKCYENGEPVTGGSSTKPQLIIAPNLTGDEDDKTLTAYRAFYSSKFGDALLSSAGNSDVSREICGFSMGGVEASLMVSGRLGKDFVGYYDEATFINITPSFQYTDAQNANMEGMTLNIVQNFHNIHGANENRRDGAFDFFTNKRGEPHLEKMSSISGVTVNLYVPDVSKDNYKVVSKMVAYAEGLGRDNLNVIQYSIPDSDLSLYGDGRDINVHGKGRTVLLPRYLAGDMTPIE